MKVTTSKKAAAFASLVLVAAGCSPADTSPSAGVPLEEKFISSDGSNPYPDGVLPVGDGKYDTSGSRFGHVYVCEDFAASLGNNDLGGAMKRGPWFTDDGTGWRPEDKPHIAGDVPVPGSFDMTVRDGRRIISTNGLPVEHTIGQFPVSPDDPAFEIDPNPNTVSEHPFIYDFPAQPQAARDPLCVGHQVGVMLRGAVLYSPLDAQGRDAVAWEVQDRCDGHPEPDGTYHYHGPSPCLPGTETDQVIGFALDGFPIVGNRTADGRELFSRDLDNCHGGVSDVVLDGETVRTYRYVMTRDFPYTVACFRGDPLKMPPPTHPPHPPGAHSHPNGGHPHP